MKALTWVVLALIILIAGYWVFEFVQTGDPELPLAIALVVLGVFAVVVRPRALAAQQTQKEEGSDE